MDEKTMRKIEDRVTETKAKSFCPPTNEAVVKAWEAFDKRVVAVYDPDTEVEIERGSSQVYGIGDAGDIIRGIELRKGSASPAEELEAWNRVSDFMGDVFPCFSNPDEDRALLIVDEWNNLMDSIADDEEEASPEIRQAAEDQKIIALGRQKGQVTGMEIYDDSVDLETISSLRKPNGTASVMLYYTTPAGVHVASYSGWRGDDEIVWAGGYVDGSYVGSDEVEQAGLFDWLPKDVRAELEPLDGWNPEDWNEKILELRRSGKVSPKDAEILDALWIIGEVYNDKVTVYNTSRIVTYMDENDFKMWGLHCVKSDEDNEDEDDEDDM